MTATTITKIDPQQKNPVHMNNIQIYPLNKLLMQNVFSNLANEVQPKILFSLMLPTAFQHFVSFCCCILYQNKRKTVGCISRIIFFQCGKLRGGLQLAPEQNGYIIFERQNQRGNRIFVMSKKYANSFAMKCARLFIRTMPELFILEKKATATFVKQ